MLHVIGFGASTVQGVGDPQGGFLARAAVHTAAAGWPVHWQNLGIGGDTTREMLTRAPALDAHRPYDLIVLLGSNDLPRPGDGEPKRRTDLEAYAANVDRLLTSIRGRRSLFVSSFVIAALARGAGAKTFAAYMAAALAAAARHGYEIWDLHAETKDGAVRKFWAADGVHFNAAGHAMIASRILPWITDGLRTA